MKSTNSNFNYNRSTLAIIFIFFFLFLAIPVSQMTQFQTIKNQETALQVNSLNKKPQETCITVFEAAPRGRSKAAKEASIASTA